VTDESIKPEERMTQAISKFEEAKVCVATFKFPMCCWCNDGTRSFSASGTCSHCAKEQSKGVEKKVPCRDKDCKTECQKDLKGGKAKTSAKKFSEAALAEGKQGQAADLESKFVAVSNHSKPSDAASRLPYFFFGAVMFLGLYVVYIKRKSKEESYYSLLDTNGGASEL